MYNILFSSGLAFLITFFSIPVIIQVARQKKMFDEPDERKVHKMVIPTLGGLGIFAGFILAILLGVPLQNAELQYFAAASIVIFFLGIKDDILILSPAKKFIGQLVAAGIVIKFGNVQLASMHGFLGITHLPHLVSMMFTLFTITVITNSFNLIDGVDGLAGSLGLLTSTLFGIYFLFAGQIMYSVIAFSLAGSLIGFLIYNVSPAKIFMGDTGSLLIGLVNSILVIKFINIAGAADSKLPIEAAPAVGFAVLIVPLFDTLRVFGHRILNRRSPFSADRTHVHHFLLEIGFNHKTITLICVGVNLLLVGLSIGLRNYGTTVVIFALLSTASLLMALLFYSRPSKKASISERLLQDEKLLGSRKILTLSPEIAEVD